MTRPSPPSFQVSWEDPVKYLLDTWPWPGDLPGAGSEDHLGNALASETLRPIRPEDVGYDESAPMLPASEPSALRGSRPGSGSSEVSPDLSGKDPLFSMLLHLQEAAANDGPLNECDGE